MCVFEFYHVLDIYDINIGTDCEDLAVMVSKFCEILRLLWKS